MNDDFLNELGDRLSELEEKLDTLSEGIEEMIQNAVEDSLENAVTEAVSDAIESKIQDAVEDAVEDAIYGAIDDAVASALETSKDSAKNTMYVLSQDKKLLVPFYSAEAVRIKKDEEPYSINIKYGNNLRRLGKYDNKDAALHEMANIAKAVSEGKYYYEMK